MRATWKRCSLGRSFSADPAGGLSVGVMVFPSTSLEAFDEMQNLGTAVSLDRERAGRLFRRQDPTASATTPAGPVRLPVPAAEPRAVSGLPDSIDVSFDPLFKAESGPGFGVSKDLVGMGGKGAGKPVAGLPLELSIDWSFRLR